MSVFNAPPLNYRQVSGKVGELPDPGDWPWPRLRYEEATGMWWVERCTESTGWVHIGWAPRPRTRRGAFRYHWHHGRLMGYPRRAVLVYALRWSRREAS